MSLQELEAIISEINAAPKTAFSVQSVRATWYKDSEIPSDIEGRTTANGGVTVEWMQRPGVPRGKAILYLHGGGYICGSHRTHRPLTAELARQFDGVVATVDYRLAPEHPYPAAVEDVLAVYKQMLSAGYAPGSIALAGDSAGGGLAVGAALAMRDEGLPLPGAIWAISPFSDLTNTGETLSSLESIDPIVFQESLTNCAELYLAGASQLSRWASPANADLAGLPPLLVQIGSREILLDDALKLARAAALANVDLTFEVWPGMVHVWHLLAPVLEEGRRGIARGAAWLGEKLRA